MASFNFQVGRENNFFFQEKNSAFLFEPDGLFYIVFFPAPPGSFLSSIYICYFSPKNYNFFSFFLKNPKIFCKFSIFLIFCWLFSMIPHICRTARIFFENYGRRFSDKILRPRVFLSQGRFRQRAKEFIFPFLKKLKVI